MAEMDSRWEYWEVDSEGDWQQTAPRSPTSFGRWMIEKRPSEAAAAFGKIMQAAITGQLEGAVAAKRTLKLQKIGRGRKAESLIIIVYTTEEAVDTIGLKLARLLKQTLKFKANSAPTKFADELRRLNNKTIHWKKGQPVFR